MIKKINNNGLLYLILAIFFTLLVRVPFLPSDISFNNDAEIYSRNIELPFFSDKYDVQMPGYISYIYLGRLFYIFIKDTVIIQHITNIILIILITTISFYLFKKIKYNNFESLIFTLLFSYNNILMLGSITGGNRLFLTLASLILIILAIKISFDNAHNFIILFSIFFAFFIGFRQDLSFYFLPLYLYLLFKVKDIKLILTSLLFFTILSLLWFIPLMIEYSGINGYLNTMKNANAVKETSIFFSSNIISPILNILRVFIYMLNAFLLTIPFFIYKIFKKETYIDKKVLIILALSFFPALILQMLVHNGNFVQLAAFMAPIFIFLTFNFKLNNFKKQIFAFFIIFLLLFQFFGIKMLDNDTRVKKVINTLWLQYSYDGAKKGKTYRLKDIVEEKKVKKQHNQKTIQ